MNAYQNVLWAAIATFLLIALVVGSFILLDGYEEDRMKDRGYVWVPTVVGHYERIKQPAEVLK